MSVFQNQIDHNVASLQEQLSAAKQRIQELVRGDQGLRKTIQALAGDVEISSVLANVLLTASEQLEAPVVEYWKHDTDTVARLIMSCREGTVRDGSDIPGDPRVSGIAIPASMTGVDSLFELRDHFISELANDPRQRVIYDPLGLDLSDWCLERGVNTLLNVQLRFGNRSLGSLCAYFRTADVLTDARIELAYAVANQITLAIRLTELAEISKQAALDHERAMEAEHRAAEAIRISSFLNATLGQMSEVGDLQLTIESIVSGMAKEIGAAHVFLFRHNAQKGMLSLDLSYMEGRIRRGLSGEELPLWAAPFPDDITPAWQIMVRNRGLFTPNMTTIPADQFAWPGAFHYIERFKLSDVGHIVLFAGNEPVGSIGFGLNDGRKLKSTDKPFIEEVAKQAALAIRMLDLAEQAKRAAVEETQRKAAQERAGELAKANTALRACMAELISLRDADRFLATFLRQSVAASGALAGAVLRRLKGTEFEFVYVSRDGEVVAGEEAVHPEVNGEVRRASSLDPTGHFARLTAGIAGWRSREDALSLHLPLITQYHRQIGSGMLFDFPFGSDAEVTGYLGLAFPGDHEPSEIVKELLTALAMQVGMALELTRLSQADKATAIAVERERAAQARADELVKANSALRLGIEQVNENRTIESLIETFLNESRKSVAAQGAAVMLRVEGTETTFRRVAVCENGSLTRTTITSDPYLGSEFEDLSSEDPIGIFASLARGETPSIRVADLREGMPATYRYHSRLGHSVIWHAPLLLRESVLGYIALAFEQDNLPSAAAKETVMALAQQLVLAMELSRLAKASEEGAVRRERDNASLERAAELAKANQALRSVNAKLTSDLDLKQFLGFVLAEATSSPKADAGAVFLLDENGNLSPAQWWEAGRVAEQVPGYPYPTERPIKAADWALWDTLCAERVARVMQAEDYYGDALAWHNSRNHARVIVAPLLLGNKPLGFLGLAYETEAEITEAALQLISALAEQTTLAVRLTQLATNAQAEAVSREQERATTEERSRLAREIHDTLAQSFSGIIVQLRAMQRAHAGDAGVSIRQVHADNALELAATGLAEARRSLASMRLTELEGRSLREALTLMAQSTTRYSGIPVEVDAAFDLDFGVENELELLRIAQESVTNAIKHSGASQIVIALRRDGNRYDLCIQDNGKGFDPKKSTEGFGLIGMQERTDRIGATMTIETTDAGTAVCVHLERGDPNAS